MAKLELDKYYTPLHIAKHCYEVAIEKIGRENITEIIEPSAGAGVFLDVDETIIGYDIKPEDSRIIEQDFLTLDIPYKEGRLVLGNPPFGVKLLTAQQFYRKAVQIGDFVAFILPISQLNTNFSFYEFDLIYSEDLGEADYSGRSLHCVFNVYKRPELGWLNKKPSNKLHDIVICRADSSNYDTFDYDVKMCYWGSGTLGKILDEDSKRYAGEYKIKILNTEHKEEIKHFIETFDWKSAVKGIAMKKLSQSRLIEILKANLPFLK